MVSRGRPKTSIPNLLNAFIQFGNVEYTLVRENYILFVAVVREKGLFFQEKVRESQGIIFLTTCINPVIVPGKNNFGSAGAFFWLRGTTRGGACGSILIRLINLP